MITLQSILDEIEIKKQEIDIEYDVDPGYGVCKEYVLKNKLQRIEDMMEIDPWGYMKGAIYLQSNKSISIEEASKIADACKSIFGDCPYYAFNRLLSMIISIVDHPKSKEIAAYITEPNKLRAGTLLVAIRNETLPISQLTHGDISDVKLHDCLKEIREIEQKRGGFKALARFIESDIELPMRILAFVSQRKKLIDSRDNVVNGKDAIPCSKRVKAKAAHEFYNSMYSFPIIKSEHDVILNFVQEEEKKKTEHEKQRRRNLYYYDELVRTLKKAESCDEVLNARELIKHLPDEELKKKVLLWIYQKNNQYHQRLQERLDELNSNSINHYIAILKKYRITVDVSKIPSMMHHTLDDVDEMLNQIPLDLFTREQIFSILQNSNLSIVQTIKKMIDLGFVRPKDLSDNMDLFQVGGEKLKKLEESINVLGSYGINQKLFAKSLPVLLGDSGVFQQNIKYLSMYNLLKSMRTTSCYDFLLHPLMVEKIDQLIELGYYSFLEQNIGLLNYGKERFQRLELLKAMNIPIDDIDTLFGVLENSKFIIKDNEIGDYLLDVVPLKEPLSLHMSLEDLEDESSDGLSVSIGNSLISLPKIKRKVAQGMSPEEAIFSGRKYSEEEYENMRQALAPYIQK
ncbi:MAG: hypothetical protein IKF71_03440 [Bacilli bacterium]|nr:hypothetical protein [Bacilli bacterium]